MKRCKLKQGNDEMRYDSRFIGMITCASQFHNFHRTKTIKIMSWHLLGSVDKPKQTYFNIWVLHTMAQHHDFDSILIICSFPNLNRLKWLFFKTVRAVQYLPRTAVQSAAIWGRAGVCVTLSIWHRGALWGGGSGRTHHNQQRGQKTCAVDAQHNAPSCFCFCVFPPFVIGKGQGRFVFVFPCCECGASWYGVPCLTKKRITLKCIGKCVAKAVNSS